MAKGKMKMLHLIRIFSQETDDEHALTLQEIIAKLATVNITADRKEIRNCGAYCMSFLLTFSVVSNRPPCASTPPSK